MRSEEHPPDRREEPVLGVLEDLEMQARGLHLGDRAVEVRELGAAQYAELDLLSRLHGAIGSPVRLTTSDGHDVQGRLAAGGSDWVQVEEEGGATSLVHLPWVVLVAGLTSRAVPQEARALTGRLSFRSVLRRLAEEGEPCAVHVTGGRVLHGSADRVGADFVELRQSEPAESVTVPLAVITVVRVRPSGGAWR